MNSNTQVHIPVVTSISYKASYVRIFCLLTFVVVCWSLQFTQAVAQVDCDPCENTEWQHATYQTTTVVPGTACTVTINYSKRFCVISDDYQLKINSIQLGSGCAPLISPMTGLPFTTEEIAVMAIAALLRDDPMGFPPQTAISPNNVAVWTLIRPSCWKKTIDPENGENIVGCEGTDCCVSQVTSVLNECSPGQIPVRTGWDHGVIQGTGAASSTDPACVCNCTEFYSRYKDVLRTNFLSE